MKKIPVYKFYKHKYGDELLVDVISYEKMMPDIRRTLVFSETFYSITLVLEADATVVAEAVVVTVAAIARMAIATATNKCINTINS